MSRGESRTAVVTGASAGIGEACALAFARRGWALALGARRAERCRRLAARCRELGAPAALAAPLDVTERASVERFREEVARELGTPHVVVANAGLARGVERLDEGDGCAWREMVETNLFGVLHTIRTFLPDMESAGRGHLIVIGSIAGRKAYAGGSVYCATKRALQSICSALRLETLGRGIRVTSVDPGMVETEFSLVRFSGDDERAAKVYAGLRPLSASDVADCVLFAAERPPHVNIDEILVMPAAQADPWHVHRTEGEP